MANNLPTEKKVTIVSMLAAAGGIRSIEPVAGIHRDAVTRLGVRVGGACASIMDEKMKNLPCERIEVDEIWGLIGKKQRHVAATERLWRRRLVRSSINVRA